MALPRRAQTTLGLVCSIALGGMLGLLWWWRRHRGGHQPPVRYRRVRVALVGLGLVTIAVGTVGRLTVVVHPLASCSPPGTTVAVGRRNAVSDLALAEKAATWPETGIGLLYAEADGAKICSSSSSDFYVGVHAALFAFRSTNVGDIVLSPSYEDPQERKAVAAHEARHRPQWAVATIIGGPLAFPIAYTVDDFFFPGPRNHFERLAGLDAGGYSHEPTGPVLGPAQIAVLAVLGAGIAVALVRVRSRRASARTPVQESA